MPELPEVETIVRGLREAVVGLRVETAQVLHPAVVRYPEPGHFAARLRGRQVQGLNRRGKYILVELDGGDLLVVHLGMTGQLLRLGPDASLAAHTHARFQLSDGSELRFRDPRRFGRLLLGGEEELRQARQLPTLGPEPLEPDFTPAELARRLRGRRAPLKALLLDQRFLAGVGNIYADEACFRARVRPDLAAGRLGRTRAARLHAGLRDALLLGIANRGSSISDYVDLGGQPGDQQSQLLVYGRGGEPCPRCGRPLRQVRIAGRTTVFCARCQR